MKTKIISIALSILLLPAMIGMLMQLIIACDWMATGGQMVQELVVGKLNNQFIAFMSSMSVLFMLFAFPYFITMIKYGYKIDTLEKEREAYHKAAEAYRAKTEEFTDKFLKDKN